jgi:DNA-binding MarR family transcriptional regulator
MHIRLNAMTREIRFHSDRDFYVPCYSKGVCPKRELAWRAQPRNPLNWKTATASRCGKRRGMSRSFMIASSTQFAILEHLRKSGPMTVNALAAELVMDRTTMGRNILPLQRDGLVAVVTDETDRRPRGLILTEAGLSRLTACYPCWSDAQSQFHAAFGARRAAELRHLMRAASASHLNREIASAEAHSSRLRYSRTKRRCKIT